MLRKKAFRATFEVYRWTHSVNIVVQVIALRDKEDGTWSYVSKSQTSGTSIRQKSLVKLMKMRGKSFENPASCSSHYLCLDGTYPQTALLQSISRGLLDCENFHCLAPLSGGCYFLCVYLQTLGRLNEFVLCTLLFLAVDFYGRSKWTQRAWLLEQESTKCPG